VLLSPRLTSSQPVSSPTPMDGCARPRERWSTSSERPSVATLPGCPPPAPIPASHC
jgi:hypothetical protein